LRLRHSRADLTPSTSDRSAESCTSRIRGDEFWASIAARHPDAGFQRVDNRLLAASPDDFLHLFEGEDGEASEVAERIVELADGTRTIAEITDVLCSEFEVERDRCRADTAGFIELLVERQLLVIR